MFLLIFFGPADKVGYHHLKKPSTTLCFLLQQLLSGLAMGAKGAVGRSVWDLLSLCKLCAQQFITSLFFITAHITTLEVI